MENERRSGENQDIDRDQVMLTCSMMTNYSEEYLGKLSDHKLMEIYDRIMEG